MKLSLKPLLFTLAALLMCCLSSCVTYERCVDKYGHLASDSTKVPIEFNVPADTAVASIPFDSLTRLQPGDTLTYKKDSTSISVTVEKNKAGERSLIIRTIREQITVRDTIILPPRVEFKDCPKPKKSFWLSAWEAYKLSAAYAVILGLLIYLSPKLLRTIWRKNPL